MSSLYQSAVDAIITNTIAVIEGTGSNVGIPGVYSSHRLLSGGAPSALTFNCTGATGKTTVEYTSGNYSSSEFVKTRAPSFWLLCTSATNSDNEGAARKISAWSQSSTEFTVSAFSQNITTGDTFYVLEGFRAAEDDTESDMAEDRRFNVTVEPGEPIDSYGSGTRTTTGELIIDLHLPSNGKSTTFRKSAMANGEMIRSAVMGRTNWESTYTRALLPSGSSIDIDQDSELVRVTIPIIYKYTLSIGGS